MEVTPKKVLVVENDEVIILLISHILTRNSYVVHTTLDALEAEQMLARDDYDAILLDLKMPNGGLDLIRKIEATNPALLHRVIVVTGAIHEATKLAGLPIHAIVRKPFEITSLLEIVRSCIEPDA